VGKPDQMPLTEAQREIMEVFWEQGEATVSAVRDALSSRRLLARNTVQTMIVRLEERGWLTHREEGRTFVYRPRATQSVSLGAKVAQMVDRLFAGSPEDMVTALIEYRGLTRDESARIRRMIDVAEANTKSKKRGT
jgi:predicted transcriptional regulator